MLKIKEVLAKKRFEVGQSVKWGPDYPRVLARNIAEYGEGPFLVEKVRDMATGCSCGVSYGNAPVHGQDCNITLLRNAGHTQPLTIATPKGSKVFSGAWFVHA